MQDRKVKIEDVGKYRAFTDDVENKNVRCAYKDCSCSPDCAACMLQDTDHHFECNRGSFVIGLPSDN